MKTNPAPQLLSEMQDEVGRWMSECFDSEVISDLTERNARFFEEATELVQAGGYSREAAHRMVDYVYDRPVGEITQEVGGVMVTLLALGNTRLIDVMHCLQVEVRRIWTKIPQIRAKQAQKPKNDV